MRCPNCGNLDDKVIESRAIASGSSIRRRRECDTCGYRFTSYEHIEEKPFRARLMKMDYSDLSPQDLVYHYNNNSMFIVIVSFADIDEPILEDTLNIWITNSDHINNDPNLNDELRLKSLEPKKMTLKFNNNYLSLIGCQMVEKISNNMFAMLVHKIEK